MRVSSGWNTDYGKKKFDLSLDEDDLKRLLHEHGVNLEEPLLVHEAFGILHNEAEAFAKLMLGREMPDMKDDLGPEITKHQQNRDAWLNKVIERIGLNRANEGLGGPGPGGD